MDVTIRFRATSEEKQTLEAGAKRAGLNLSSWLRGVSLSAAGDVAHVEGSPEPESLAEEIAKAAKKVSRDPARSKAKSVEIGRPFGTSGPKVTVRKGSGGFVRREEIPKPDWMDEPVPERTDFTPVPKTGKKR